MVNGGSTFFSRVGVLWSSRGLRDEVSRTPTVTYEVVDFISMSYIKTKVSHPNIHVCLIYLVLMLSFVHLRLVIDERKGRGVAIVDVISKLTFRYVLVGIFIHFIYSYCITPLGCK